MIDTIKIAVPLNLVTFRSYDNFNIDALYLERVLSWQAAPIKAPFKPYREHTTDEKIHMDIYQKYLYQCIRTK